MQLIIFNKLYKDDLIIIKYYYFFHITVMRMRLLFVGNCIKRYLFIYSPESELPLIWIALTQLLRYVFYRHVEQSGPHLTADLVAQQTSFTDGHASQSGHIHGCRVQRLRDLCHLPLPSGLSIYQHDERGQYLNTELSRDTCASAETFAGNGEVD